MLKKGDQRRDTVKDIILGLEPSGSGPREPRGGYARTITTTKTNERRSQPIIVEGTDPAAINRLRDQLQSLQRQQHEMLNSEALTKKRLEKDYEDLKRKMRSNDSSREIDELRRQLSNLESKVNSLSQELSITKTAMDRLSKNELHRSEERGRYTGDQSRTSSQLNDLSEQISRLKQALNDEVADRNAASRSYTENINSIRDGILKDLNSKTGGLENRTMRTNHELEEIRSEVIRFNEKLQRRLSEVERKLNANEAKLKENMKHERNYVENDFRQQIRLHQDSLQKLENRAAENMEKCLSELQELKTAVEEEKQTADERIKTLEKNLLTLKKKLKTENEKINSVLTADINSRKIHENGILAKMDYMEEQLKAHLENITKTIEDDSKKAQPEQSFDVDTVRREMESIAADKNKMSIEGLLRLEEKVRKMNQDISRYNIALRKKLDKLSEDENSGRIKQEMNRLNQLQQEFEESQRRLADKIERQIPQDLNELSAKTNHIKQQLNDRIDRVEEENFQTTKELDEVKAAAKHANASENNAEKPPSKAVIQNTIDAKIKPLEEDFGNYKIAVKKLAESVTTVKNVLEKRIDNELRKQVTSGGARQPANNKAAQ